MLPAVSSATAANASELRLPSRVAVRSAADHLWSLVTGAHAAAPSSPAQETGTASAHPHQVPASVTRAVRAATGQAPGQAPGQLPAYTWHAPQAGTYLAGRQPAPGQDPYNAATSKFVASDSSATSDVYQNADGSYTKHVYAEPVNYKTSSGSWAAISTALSAGTGGRWQENANSAGVGFAPKADDPDLSSLSLGTGLSVSYGLAGAAAVTGTASGSAVTYPSVLPGTDLVERGLASGVSESLVLHSAQAATTWTFPLHLTGLTAQLASDGSVQLVDSSGQVQGVIPAGMATDSHFDPGAGPDGAQTPVTYQLVSYNGGTALQASIDPAWLADPARVFPVTVDPSVNAPTSSSTYVQYPDTSNNSGTAVRKVGTWDGGTNDDRTFLGFANLGASLKNEHITAAQLHVFDIWAYTCSYAEPFDAYLITQAWDPKDTTTWPGPSIGEYLGQDDSVAPAAACTNNSGAQGTGGWMSMSLATDFLNGWALGTTPDYGIALTASNTDSYGWKQFDSDYTSYVPYLSITYLPDVAPQIDSQYPPSNYNTTSLTPELMAYGVDQDNWPDALQYQFTVYNTAGKALVSRTQSSPDYTVPKGTLAWGQTYYWVVQDTDGLDYNQNPQIYYFSTPVPQPLIASGLSQNTSGPGFDPSTGNYTTSVTDAQVATTGPSLSIERDYNSLNSDPTGAFGSGWSSILDMQVAPGEVDSTGVTPESMVVTYPDGEQVAFGANADGTYTAPQGRFATFATASGGGYTLTDKNDTVYKFAQPLAAGSGAYGITAITDALGRALTFTYNSSNQVTTMTSAASGRALHLTWSSASGSTSAHVASVTTDPVTAGSSASALTWTYNYTGDQLNSACPPASTTACTAYTYTPGSHYQDAVLDSGPHSYWRMDETAGTIAASSVLANEGTDKAAYSGVTLGQGAPLPGSSATSAAFNGTSSYATLPSGLVSGASYQSLSAWFRTTATGGVIFSSSADAISKSSTTNQYVPMLYIGAGGDLNAEYWNGGFDPMLSTSPVNDGKWHLAVLTAAGNTESLYVDGQLQGGATSGAISMLNPQDFDYAGTGFLGGSWPHEPNTNSTNTGYPTYFSGNMSDVALWDRPLTGSEIRALYTAGTQQASLLTKVTRPSGTIYSQVSYDGLTSDVTSMTDNNGGSWTLASPSVTGSSQVYVSSVLGADPADYYRLTDTGTNQAVDQVIGGTATYANVTEGVTGPFSDATADSFNGSSSSVALPLADQTTTSPGSIELWFRTTGDDEVLYSSDTSALGSGSVTGRYVPSLYIGAGGDLNGAFWTGHASSVITSASPVNDGKWHFAVLSASTSSEQLYVDGQPQQQGGLSATLAGSQAAHVYLGGGYLGGTWPHQPNMGSTATPSWFSGSIAEFASYRSQLTDAQVVQQYGAAKSSAGLAPEEKVTVTDPGGKTLTDAFDPLNGDRVVAQTDALGSTTRYGYDTSGFLNTVTDPDGDVTTTGHDARGNLVSETTCQDQTADKCSTSYYTYYLKGTLAAPQPDPGNDLLKTESDGRSSSASDTTYQTGYTYNSLGELTAETTPPVAGHSSGRTTTTTYTDGTTVAAVGGGYAPAGLPSTVTSPGGALTQTRYYSDGDVAQTVDADHLVTSYTYDGLGRVLTKTVVSDSYPNGLTTSYTYNQLGQVTQETDPAVTDRVTGAVHTAKISTSYDADGDVTGQTVADGTGGDASRSAANTYDSHDLLATSTDPAQVVTRYTYGPYGDLATETDPAGNVTDYGYDANGQLLTTTLASFTGDPASPSPATSLVESTRAYDPAGRLASITDSMGWVTSYTYTDNGLTAAITRSDPHTGASFTQQSNGYDGAGNLISQTTNNGATTTAYQVDAADRTDAETVDPGGLDRTTTYSCSPDDDLLSRTLTGGGSSTPVSSASWTYDAMGNKTSQAQALAGASPLTTSWTLDQRGLPTSMTDPDGSTTRYSYDEAGRLAVTTSPAITTQTYGGSAASTVPVTMTGFNTFGEPVETSDADGNVTTTGYDADGRADAVTSPPYTPPGGSPITATSGKTYNGLGQVSSETDALNHKTSFTYDQLGDVATVTDPDGGLTHYTYDTDGDQLTETGPTGAVTGSTYDYLGRKLTDTAVERYPAPASYTTNYSYGTNGWLSSQTSPDGVSDSYTYDAAGETATQTDGASNKTSYGYGAAGDLTSTVNPDGTSATASYDEAGRQTGQADLSGTGTVLRSESATYNGDGDQASATDYRGSTTTDTYDADGDLTQEAQPVTASTAITTSFGYDAAGNQTRYTDGNGHQWWTTYNSWNLPESQIEPATAQYTTAADSTFTTAYDAGGNPATETEPGGVTITDSYDTMGDLTGQSGSGAEAATTARSFGYDDAGHLTSASAPGGTDTFTYNDRGSLLSAAGPSGSSSFGYNGDGQASSVSDAAGMTSYTYDSDGRLATLADPATGTTASYSYNPESQVSQISYGSGNDTRTFGYNNLHEQTADTLATSSGQTVASIGYGYDANGNLTAKTTTGFSGSSSNTYTYDDANRLASWNNGTTTVNYGYDGAGNRTQAGGRTYTYDARDELTSDGTNSYAYTARGTLSSEGTSAGTLHFAADAFGQSITQSTAQGSQTYAYDGLGRVVSDTGSGTGAASASFSYSGSGSTLASDGSWTYTWDPSGTSLAGVGVAGGSAAQGTIAWADQHSDVVGDFTAAGTSLAGSTSYDPLGTVLSASGQSGRLGYQSSWTDPATKKVDMGARWYDPSTGQFQSKDTTTVNPENNSAAANPFAYAGDDPLGATDPDGHKLCADSVCGSVSLVSYHHVYSGRAASSAPARSGGGAPSYAASGGGWSPWSVFTGGWHDVVHGADVVRHATASAADRVVKLVKDFAGYAEDRGIALLKESISAVREDLVVLSNEVNDVKKEVVQKTAAVISEGEQVGSRVYRTVTTYARQGYDKTTTAVKTAYHAAAK
ncbi:MAG TPA: LamG-like jellyroll fold domain-containing protein, partial [Streptosporangiaceae bacterium]